MEKQQPGTALIVLKQKLSSLSKRETNLEFSRLTTQGILEKYNSKEILSINSLKKADEIQLENVLKLALINFTKALNVGNSLTPDQINSLAINIHIDYGYLTVEDLILVLQNIIKCKYGEIYNRVDVNTIYSALKKYDLERTDLIVEANVNEKNSQKYGSPERTCQPRNMKDFLADFKKRENEK